MKRLNKRIKRIKSKIQDAQLDEKYFIENILIRRYNRLYKRYKRRQQKIIKDITK